LASKLQMDSKLPKQGRGRGRPKTTGAADSGVKTVHVATKILDALAEFSEPARVTDLAKKLDMTLSTVSRHVSTWRELGFIEKAEPHETYRLGAKLFSLGQAATEQNSHVSIAFPHLIEFRDRINETTMLSSRVQQHATALLCFDSKLAMAITVRPGAILYLPHSVTARVLWAFASSEDPRARLENSRIDFSYKPLISKKAFAERISRIRKDCYDFDPNMANTGLGAISCPIFERNTTVECAITVIFPARGSRMKLNLSLLDEVRECAKNISRSLGAKSWGGEKI
jgi:DNA-binding IclR family transcriptional regulator